jgi:hypothetical protein
MAPSSQMYPDSTAPSDSNQQRPRVSAASALNTPAALPNGTLVAEQRPRNRLTERGTSQAAELSRLRRRVRWSFPLLASVWVDPRFSVLASRAGDHSPLNPYARHASQGPRTGASLRFRRRCDVPLDAGAFVVEGATDWYLAPSPSTMRFMFPVRHSERCCRATRVTNVGCERWRRARCIGRSQR